MEQELTRRLGVPAREALAAVGRAAESWEAAWEASPVGGRLHLPVLAGIRRGRMLARVEVRATPDGSEIRLSVESAEYDVNRPALVFLLLGALGGLVTVIWPLAPDRLLGFVPLAVVLMIGAWLLVASRLRTAGPEDFLDTVAELAEGDREAESDSADASPIQP